MRKRRQQDLILGVISGIGVFLIISAAWVFTKGQRMSLYTDERAGYSIKYPADWTVQKPAGETTVIFISRKDTELDIFRENVSVVVQDLSGGPMDLKKYSELAVKQTEIVFGENVVVLESRPARLANRQGYEFEFLGKGPDAELHYLIYWTVDGATAYQVTFTSLASQYENNLPKALKMIRSFRIL